MELKNILNEKSQEIDDYTFDSDAIIKSIRAKSLKELRYIVGFQKLSLLVNTIFIILFLSLYYIYQKQSLIFPLWLITFSFIIIIYDTIRYLKKSSKIDRNTSTNIYLQRQLNSIENLEKSCKNRLPIVSTMGFIGGFLSGLIINGWSYSKILEQPLVLVILVIISSILFIYVRKKSFSGLNKLVTKTYQEKKNQLKKNYNLLNEIS